VTDGIARLLKEMRMVCFKVLCLEVSVDREKPWINGSGQSIFELRYDSGTDEPQNPRPFVFATLVKTS
jgi:hypothetical protein